MVPLPVFEKFTMYACLMDLSYASILMIIAQLLRRKLGILQYLYVPASLLAGILGLILGPQFLNILPFSGQAATYAAMLILPLYASLPMGYTGKRKGGFVSLVKATYNLRDYFFSNIIESPGQYLMGGFLGYLVCKRIWPDLNDAFGYLLASGFAGGHGNATTMGTFLESKGFEGALGIGLTFATVGLLGGILLGMVNINIATKIGATRFVKSIADTPKEMRTGWIPEEKRANLGMATMSPSSIDPLAWHFCLVFGLGGLAYYLDQVMVQTIGFSITAMCIATLLGIAVQSLFNSAGLGDYVNKTCMNRVGSTITDFLVFFGIVSVRTDIVLQYAGPIALMCLFGFLWCELMLWWLSPKLHKHSWFERGIYMFGCKTGVTATGIALLRVVDPEFKSKNLEDQAKISPLLTWSNYWNLILIPGLAVTGHIWLSFGLQGAVVGAGFIAAIATGVFKSFTFKYYKSEYFEAEALKRYGPDDAALKLAADARPATTISG